MTNIAFATLVILALSSPGYIFRVTYYFNTFTTQVLPKNWTDDIARAIFYSVPFHLVTIFLLDLSKCYWGRPPTTLTFEHVARLLTGQYGKDGSEFSFLILQFSSNKTYLAIYATVVLSLSYGFGHLLRHIVWNNEWDVRYPWLFRYENSWLYSLLGRGKLEGVSQKQTIAWADVLTNQPTEIEGKNQIYRGVIAGFSVSEDGSLRQIILTRTRRGKFKIDVNGGKQFSFELIEPGDYFLIPYDCIQNMNVTYLSSE